MSSHRPLHPLFNDERGRLTNPLQLSSGTIPDLADRIASTAFTAARAKASAASRRYFDDPYVSLLLPPYCSSNESGGIIQPMIRRGYAARQAAVDAAIRGFLQVTEIAPRRQVVILGSGMDTTYLRYRDGSLFHMHDSDAEEIEVQQHRQRQRQHRTRTDWWEVDCPAVIHRKQSALAAMQIPSVDGAFEQNSGNLNFVCHDLKTEGILEALSMRVEPHPIPPDNVDNAITFDAILPTLFVAECVFMYLPCGALRSLLSSISTECTHPYLCVYDPIPGTSSTYGKMMVRNLRASGVIPKEGCAMTDPSCANVCSYLNLLKETGWGRDGGSACGCTMGVAYQTVISSGRRKAVNAGGRISPKEGGDGMLDELEEMEIIMKHYALLVAEAGSNTSKYDGLFSEVVAGKKNVVGFYHGQCETL